MELDFYLSFNEMGFSGKEFYRREVRENYFCFRYFCNVLILKEFHRVRKKLKKVKISCH